VLTDAEVPAVWQQLGLPGLADIHVHFLPPAMLAKVWAYFDNASQNYGTDWPIHYRTSDDERIATLKSLGVQRFPTLLPAQARDGGEVERLERRLRAGTPQGGAERDVLPRTRSRAVRPQGARRWRPGLQGARAGGGVRPGASVRPMLEHRGYQIGRYFHEMQRPLPGSAIEAAPAVPVQPHSNELDETIRLAHNDAFSTHWGSTPTDKPQWQSNLSSATFRPDCSFVALSPSGEVESYVLAAQWVEGELYIELVGTRQSGSVGFEVVRVIASYLKNVPGTRA
jgi:hypothetical protein